MRQGEESTKGENPKQADEEAEEEAEEEDKKVGSRETEGAEGSA